MGRIDDDRLDDCDLELVFIAGSRLEAKNAEEVLTAAGIDYALDFEPFQRTSLFGPMSLTGVGFFVLVSQAAFCRELLQENKLGRGIVDAPAD